MLAILKLDIGGIPEAWITIETAACLIAANATAWTLGDTVARLRGGTNAISGRQSVLDVPSIVAVHGKARGCNLLNHVPTLDRRKLARRDRHVCAYCGERFTEDLLTIDHVKPLSRGGTHAWTNVLAACAPCNNAKADREPHEWGRLPLFAPYAPNRYEGLILANRRILADQMEFLVARVSAKSRVMQ